MLKHCYDIYMHRNYRHLRYEICPPYLHKNSYGNTITLTPFIIKRNLSFILIPPKTKLFTQIVIISFLSRTPSNWSKPPKETEIATNRITTMFLIYKQFRNIPGSLEKKKCKTRKGQHDRKETDNQEPGKYAPT